MAARVAAAAAGLLGGGLAGYAASRPTLVPWPTPMRAVVPAMAGLVVGGAAAAVGAVATVLLTGPDRGPGLPAVARADLDTGRSGLAPAMAAVSAAAAVTGVVLGRRALLRRLLADGRALEDGFRTAPGDPLVSGGPGSLVPYPSVGREGARFVSLPSTPLAIRDVTGRPALHRPIRVFVGYDAAGSAEQRVALALAELHRTGAFDRSLLVVEAPAGTGFANATPVEVVELLARGDVATVAVGYGLLPSFLSLDRVRLAARTQRLLLEAIAAEWEHRPAGRRPRLLLYGESLGATVQQAALRERLTDLDALHVDTALWVGTPGSAASDALHAAVAGVSVTVDRAGQVPQVRRDPRPRVWFLEHDGDPVVRFRPRVLVRRPDWLARRPRGRNVPERMRWWPGITWLQLLVDTLFATDVRPGQFDSRGHDYREDLGTVVAAAYGLPLDPLVHNRLEQQLRHAEVERAERIGQAVAPATQVVDHPR